MSQPRPGAQAPSGVSTTQTGSYRVSAAIFNVNQGRVTVNNEPESMRALTGTPTHVTIGAGTRKPVTITPISSLPPPSIPKPPSVIQKVLLKAVSKVGKSGAKMFTLRGIDSSKVASRDNLKAEIRGQLQGDIVSSDFDVGYVSGNSVISIRNPDDLSEIWSDVKKGNKIVLWCDGLKTKGSVGGATTKRKQATDSDIEKTDEEEDEVRVKSQKKKKKKTAQEEHLGWGGVPLVAVPWRKEKLDEG